jgi:hypothetical protein
MLVRFLAWFLVVFICLLRRIVGYYVKTCRESQFFGMPYLLISLDVIFISLCYVIFAAERRSVGSKNQKSINDIGLLHFTVIHYV